MEDYSHYDNDEDDPYCRSGTTCLINHLGIRNTAALNAAEAQYCQVRMAGLAQHSIKPTFATFDLPHLQRIHHRLFGDVYPFAGKIRTVDIGKGGHPFLPYQFIQTQAYFCFAQLHDQNLLRGLDAESFGDAAGYYLGWINKIHPFREGNGRTQRILIDQLALQNNLAVEWSAISQDAMAMGYREARTVNSEAPALRKLLRQNTVHIKPVANASRIKQYQALAPMTGLEP